ncbi:MAG: hypothetical protein ACHQVS_02910, partial [Candidatus Babeliales bacterium]
YMQCAVVCLGMQSYVGATEMVRAPKPRAESVPAGSTTTPIAITPRAASDSGLRKKKLEMRGRSFIPEFLMKEERTPEDFAMMETVSQQLEADLLRRQAGALAFGIRSDKKTKNNFKNKYKRVKEPLFHAHTDIDDTTNYVKPNPISISDEEESAVRKARLEKRFAQFKLKKQSSLRVVVTSPHQEKTEEVISPLDLYENELQFNMDDV